MNKRGQISLEYLILVGFIVFLIVAALGSALFYSSILRDQLKFKQLEGFADNIILNSESIFFAGAPSQATISAYLPKGVEAVQIIDNDLVFNVSTSEGLTVISFGSEVPLTGTITSSSGVKRITLIAGDTGVSLTEG